MIFLNEKQKKIFFWVGVIMLFGILAMLQGSSASYSNYSNTLIMNPYMEICIGPY